MRSSYPTPDPRGGTRLFRAGMALAAAAWGVALLALWQLALLMSLTVDPRVSIAWTLAVSLAFLQIYAISPVRRRSRARLRVRSPGRSWPWLLGMMVPFALLPQALWCALLALGLAHEPAAQPEVESFIARPFGEPAFWLLAIGAAPLLEEFGFRGWVQRPLERAFGAMPAVATSALLFALAHGEPELIPARLAGGLVLGHAVYASRSIWSGVLLHLGWNLGGLALGAVAADVDPTGKGWVWAGPCLAATALCLVWCAWAVRGMHDASAPRPPRGSLTPAAAGPVRD